MRLQLSASYTILTCRNSATPCPLNYWRGRASRAWMTGARGRYESNLRQQRRIDAPVISVGNLSMGGTGKTPCVLRVAELLKSRGKSPGILTRGYGRVSPDKILTLAPGANLSSEKTGDEPQIFLRSGIAPVGIGADRYEAGMQLREKFAVDVLVLDDGFQHVQLARDIDIVLIDALDPLGGGGVFPLGSLREPFRGDRARGHCGDHARAFICSGPGD